MNKLKMSKATDILLEHMIALSNLYNQERTITNKRELKEAIDTSKTLNGSASCIIKEAAVALSIELQANKQRQDLDRFVEKLNIDYDEK